MNTTDLHQALQELFYQTTGTSAEHIVALPRSGSSRQYFRLHNDTHSLIGVYNDDMKENKAFISFSASLHQAGINVPRIVGMALDKHIYLQSDLGDMTLFEYIKTCRVGQEFPEQLTQAYQKVLQQLPRIQTEAVRYINFEDCYPRAAFDKQSMMWDLNYFKYYFLKLAGIPFDEQALENDFRTLVAWLLESPSDFFLYRDFQSRNIMLVGSEPYFIDYQGGRRGALQYDLASLLYDSKAALSEETRSQLLEYYLDELSKYRELNRQEFREFFYGFVLIRIMQAMGAYGYRGFFERKELFLQSIPYALDNLKAILQKAKLPVQLPTLHAIWQQLANSEKLRKIGTEAGKLRVRIQSFSYRRGLPQDTSEHGGGFIFDCRSIHNPGRYPEYQSANGRDESIRKFFANEPEMIHFNHDVQALVGRAVQKYITRKFNYLSVSFGCTGGQHRSVYCAETLAQHLRQHYDVIIELNHREQRYWPTR